MVISEYVKGYIFYYVAQRELTKVDFGVCEVYTRYIFSKSVLEAVL